MAPTHMKKHIDLLKLLKKLKCNELKTVIGYLDDIAINVLCELCFNALYTQLNISNRNKKKLKGSIDKRTIVRLSNRNRSTKSRKKLLKQSGGFVSVLLGALVPVLIDLVYKVATK